MKRRERWSRRSMLLSTATAGVIGLAGCSGSDPSGEGSTREEASPSEDRSTDTDEPTSGDDPTDTATSGSDGGGTWRSVDGGAGNTGSNLETAVSATEPTAEELYSPDELYGIPTVSVIDDGTIVGYSGDDYLHAVSTSGEQEWTFEVSAAGEVSPFTPAIRGDTVYFPASEGLVAVAGGERQWAVSVTPNAAPVVTDEAVYQTTADGVDALVSYGFDGTERWRAESEDWNLSRPAIDGSTVVQFGRTSQLDSASTAVIAWDAADGINRWVKEDVGSGPVPVATDGTVYTVQSTDGGAVLTALSLEDGSILWETDPVSGAVETTPAVADDEIYLATESDLYAFETSDGTSLWSSPYVATESIIRSPRVDAESVYLTIAGEKIVAVDRESADQRWSVGLEETASSGYTNLSIVDGTAYVATDNVVAIS